MYFFTMVWTFRSRSFLNQVFIYVYSINDVVNVLFIYSFQSVVTKFLPEESTISVYETLFVYFSYTFQQYINLSEHVSYKPAIMRWTEITATRFQIIKQHDRMRASRYVNVILICCLFNQPMSSNREVLNVLLMIRE